MSDRSDRESKYFSCSFCKRRKNEVQKLIAGKNSKGMITFICDMCTEVCYMALKNTSKTGNKDKFDLVTPQKIYDELEKHVESQEEAKRILSVAAYNHYKRINYSEENQEVKIDKSNILMIGKSGSGKTLLVETLSKILDVPFVSVDVTTMTEAGYVGEDAEICINKLFQAAKNDVNKTEKGIVFLDEVDKLRKKSSGVDGALDVSGVGVQHSLLKIIEGTTVNVSPSASKKSYNQDSIAINTKNILFICAGAFEDLVKIVSKDTNVGIGFNKGTNISEYDAVMKHLKTDHLIKYGMVPEFIGRLQVPIVLQELTKENLVHILTEPQHAILKQYKKLLSIKDNADLQWTPAALELIAEQAIKSKTGARGLKAIVEKILTNIMFSLPSNNAESVVLIDAINDEISTNIIPLEEFARKESKVVAL